MAGFRTVRCKRSQLTIEGRIDAPLDDLSRLDCVAARDAGNRRALSQRNDERRLRSSRPTKLLHGGESRIQKEIGRYDTDRAIAPDPFRFLIQYGSKPI